MPGAGEGATVERHSRVVQRRRLPAARPPFRLGRTISPCTTSCSWAQPWARPAPRWSAASGPTARLRSWDEALVASSHEEVASRNDPTAHAVILALREAAKRLETRSLSGLTVFSTVEPCSMCVGALLEADAGLPRLRAARSRRRRRRLGGPAGQQSGPPAPARPHQRDPSVRRRRAARGRGRLGSRRSAPSRRGPAPSAAAVAFAILRGGEVSEWLKVPLSKSGVRKHRGFESHPLRHSHPDPTARRAHRPGPRRTARGEVA